MAYADVAEAREFAGLGEESSLRVRTILNLAERGVSQLAPAPTQGEEETEEAYAARVSDHADKAHDAALLVFEYLWQTRGYVADEAVMSRKITYVTNGTVQGIVMQTMPEYVVAGTGRAFRTRNLERA